MDRKEICSAGDVLRQIIDESNMSGRLAELKAADYWPCVVGPDIASKTMKPYVFKGVMTIRVPDASLRNELSMYRSAMIRELNRLAGSEAILSLRFTS